MDQASQRLTAPRLIETMVAAVLVVLMSGALIGPVLDPLQLGGEDAPFLRLMWLPAYGAMMLLAAWRAPRLLPFWLPGAGFALLIAWCFASAQWSIDPSITERRALAVGFTTLFGLYLAASYPGRALSELVAGVFLVLGLGSLAVCIALPGFGVHNDINAGDWKGLWYEKNEMGAMMVYGALAAASAALAGPRRRTLWVATVVLCAALVIMSRSKTALVMLMVVLAGTGAIAAMRKGPATAVILVWLGTLALLVGAAVLWLAPEAVFGALGKDPSLTGRTEIWANVLRWSAQKPLLGYGYGVFWSHESVPGAWVDKALNWDVPSAHNGWLDLLVQIGWIGAAGFGLMFAAAMIAALPRLDALRDGGWAAVFLAVFFIAVYSESFILARNSLPWMLAAAAMARVLGPKAAAAGVSAARVFGRRAAPPAWGLPAAA